MANLRSIVAVIPARGGSKRIPRKNVVDFCGKPLLAWTLEAAIDSRIFDRIIVSTDDEEIAAVARRFGADVPFMRTRFADDQTPVSAVTIDVVRQLQAGGATFDVVVQLLPSCPLRNGSHIAESYEAFRRREVEFQLSACAFHWQNPWWAFRIDSADRPLALFPEALKQRSQDLEPLYCPSGAIWIARTDALLRDGTFYGKDYRLEPIEMRAAVDIDSPSDLAFAAALACDPARGAGAA